MECVVYSKELGHHREEVARKEFSDGAYDAAWAWVSEVSPSEEKKPFLVEFFGKRLGNG